MLTKFLDAHETTARLDPYTKKARLGPAQLAALPPCLVVSALAWTIGQPMPGISIGVFALATIPHRMESYTETIGKRIEPSLWQKWGGPPTSQLLSHRGRMNPYQRDLVHNQIIQFLPEGLVPLPTPADEQADPHDTDQRWEAIFCAIKCRLRAQPLLKQRCCDYAFQRNMFGLRILGRRVALASAAVAGISAAICSSRGDSPALLISVTVVALAAAWLWHRLADEHVLTAARGFGEAFVQAVLSQRSDPSPADLTGDD